MEQSPPAEAVSHAAPHSACGGARARETTVLCRH
jgi:hypothetical protein